MPQVGLGSPHKNAETITPLGRRDYGPAHTAGVWGPRVDSCLREAAPEGGARHSRQASTPTRPLDTRLARVAAPIEPGPRPPGVHSVRLLRPPEDSRLRVVLVAPIFGARTVFSRDRGGNCHTQRVGGNRCWLHHPPSTGESLSSVGCHGLVGQAMAAVAQRRQVRKLVSSAVLGTNKMVDGKLRRRTAMPTAVAVSCFRSCSQLLPCVLAQCWS
jgi:hypothetical protein